MISREALARGYNHGAYTVGAPTQPLWKTAGLDQPLSGTPLYGAGQVSDVSDEVVVALRGIADEVITAADEVAERTRDWWPGTMLAHTEGQPATPDAVFVTVSTTTQVQEVVRLAAKHQVPVTVSAGRSNVTGSALPVCGGIVLDVCSLNQVLSFNQTDLTVNCEAGIFGDVLEQRLQSEWNVTTGHWPQSFALSTVGGWIACRGAGQLSTRYGKIEDMVVEIDVVLADGELVTLGRTQRGAVGPELRELFLGSEGTLGIITRAVLRTHHLPDYYKCAAFTFDSFHPGLDACRAVLQAGVTPAVLRLYDELEARHHGFGESAVLIIADEGDPLIVDATMQVACREAARYGVEVAGEPLYERWLNTRFEIGSIAQIDREKDQCLVADTLEMTGSWSVLGKVYDGILAAVGALPGTVHASAHQSHAYTDSACVYFTFAGVIPFADRRRWYRAAWDAANQVIMREGARLSHHHGIGVVRSPYMPEAMGNVMGLLTTVKHALDPAGILNPAKLGL